MKRLEFAAWESSKKNNNRPAEDGTAKNEKHGKAHYSRAEGKNQMDRFQYTEQGSEAACKCGHCGNTLAEGDEALVTGQGIFCDFDCYGREIAEQEGEREQFLTREDIENAAV